ncbi:MAG: MATE family efflux transporter [Deltaproteobacteria bacterium]
MLTRNTGSLLLKLSWPAMAGNVIYSLLCLVETYFVSMLGTVPLAVTTLTIPTQIFITAIGSAAGVGLTSYIARTLGEGRKKEAVNAAWHGILLAFIMGLLMWWVGTAYLDDMLVWSGCSQETFALSKTYLTIILSGSVITFLAIILANIMQGAGDTLWPMLTSLAGLIVNVILDPPLIFGCGFIPAQGLSGVAIATVLGNLCAGALTIVILVRRYPSLTRISQFFVPRLRIIMAILRVGMPALVMEAAALLVMVFMNRTLVTFGSSAVAVLGIFLRIRSLVYMPVFGLTQGIMPVAGFAYGGGLPDRVKETMVKACTTAFILIAVPWAVIQGDPAWIMHFFSHNPTLSRLGEECLRWASLVLPLMGPIIVLTAILQAVDRGMEAMWLSLFRQILTFLPLIVLLPPWLGLNGVWLAFALSEALAALLGCWLFKLLWKQLSPPPRPRILVLSPGYTAGRIMAWLRW